MSPKKSALVGFLFILPFFFLNLIVSGRVGEQSVFTPLLLLLLFPTGAFICLKPIFQKKKIYPLNLILSSLIMLIFLILFTALAEEMYRCDILKIPNCD